MRRRRKSKYSWFPVLGSIFSGDGGTHRVSTFFNELTVRGDDSDIPTVGNGMFIMPLVPDFTPQEAGGTTEFTLSDFVQGQDYILKRIVGKIFVSLDQPQGTTAGWPSILVTAGFFVARNDEDNTADIALDDTSIDPQGLLNVQNPWIWRRQWMLGNPGVFADAFTGNPGWPQNNAGYPGVLDGPHIDSKVARRIVREQRLWFVCSAMGISPGGTQQPPDGADTRVNVALDVRILGAMRRAKNKSAF